MSTPGTIAHQAIQYLKKHRERMLTTEELAQAIAVQKRHLPQQLSPAVKAGVLLKKQEGNFLFWGVGHNIDEKVAPTIKHDERTILKVSAAAAPSIFAFADQRGCAYFSAAQHTDGRIHCERHGRIVVEFTNHEAQVLRDVLLNGVRPS
jgi:hypothetical protein